MKKNKLHIKTHKLNAVYFKILVSFVLIFHSLFELTIFFSSPFFSLQFEKTERNKENSYSHEPPRTNATHWLNGKRTKMPYKTIEERKTERKYTIVRYTHTHTYNEIVAKRKKPHTYTYTILSIVECAHRTTDKIRWRLYLTDWLTDLALYWCARNLDRTNEFKEEKRKKKTIAIQHTILFDKNTILNDA